MISILTLNINNYNLLKNFIDSIKKHTVNTFELIIVDNGSTDENVIQLIKNEADKYILNEENLGFSKGFNQALELCSYETILMSNNDTEYPAQWDEILIHEWNTHKNIGLLYPCYTSGMPIGLRTESGSKTIALEKFGDIPSGVSIFTTRSIMKELGGWCEDYGLAAGEDLDLCFNCWEHGYNVFLTEKVVVYHVGKQTAKMLGEWRKLWAENDAKFRKKWAHHL